MSLTKNDFEVVDLFCGIGGLSHGFVKEKFKVVAGIDFDKSCNFAYTQNNDAKFLYRDIKDFSGEELTNLYSIGKRKILVGCAPCQPFSIYNRNSQDQKEKNDKWSLLYSFSKLINETEPEIVSMENVPLLTKFDEGKIFNEFIENLKIKDYKISWSIVNAQDYGVAQRRKRLILLASKLGDIKLIPPTHNKTNFVNVKDIIGNLNPIKDGEADPNDELHYSKKLNEINKRRIQATKEGGSWKDWDDELKLACHKREGGKKFGSAYGRMRWNDVAPTMTTYCIGLSNGRFGHPEQDRAISLREAALIQSFPENYNFIDPHTEFRPSVIARQIGNAVPVNLGVAIAKSIKTHLQNID